MNSAQGMSVQDRGFPPFPPRHLAALTMPV